jgi:hypothetical protein
MIWWLDEHYNELKDRVPTIAASLSEQWIAAEPGLDLGSSDKPQIITALIARRIGFEDLISENQNT